MHCFLCMTYVILFCNALPPMNRKEFNDHERRSLFRDVIESLRIRAQLPDELNQNNENNLANYERYGYENEPPQLPSDVEFIPRRNDRIERIEIPNLKYRYPKSVFDKNESRSADPIDHPKEEIVLYISTTKEPKPTTVKPKKPQKRPQPITNVKVQYKDDEEIVEDADQEIPEEPELPQLPVTNTMAGQSQIGNRESQMVVKPTVIINFRGSVSHKDSDIRLSGRKTDENSTQADTQPNVFNIKQEVNLERTFSGMGSRGAPKNKDLNEPAKVERKDLQQSDDTDMMMCETAASEKKMRDAKRFDNVLEIFFTV